jgi:hypothetical protein
MDNIEAIKNKNVELSAELASSREQLDKINLEFVVMKHNNIDALNVATTEHEL